MTRYLLFLKPHYDFRLTGLRIAPIGRLSAPRGRNARSILAGQKPKASDPHDRSYVRRNRGVVLMQSAFYSNEVSLSSKQRTSTRGFCVSADQHRIVASLRENHRGTTLFAQARDAALSRWFGSLARIRSPVRSAICMQSRLMASRNSIVRSQTFIRRCSTNLSRT